MFRSNPHKIVPKFVPMVASDSRRGNKFVTITPLF